MKTFILIPDGIAAGKKLLIKVDRIIKVEEHSFKNDLVGSMIYLDNHSTEVTTLSVEKVYEAING